MHKDNKILFWKHDLKKKYQTTENRFASLFLPREGVTVAKFAAAGVISRDMQT